MTPEQEKKIAKLLRLIKNNRNNEVVDDAAVDSVVDPLSDSFVEKAVAKDLDRMRDEKEALAKKEAETKLKMEMGKESIEKLRKDRVFDRKTRVERAKDTLKTNPKSSDKDTVAFADLLRKREKDVEVDQQDSQDVSENLQELDSVENTEETKGDKDNALTEVEQDRAEKEAPLTADDGDASQREVETIQDEIPYSEDEIPYSQEEIGLSDDDVLTVDDFSPDVKQDIDEDKTLSIATLSGENTSTQADSVGLEEVIIDDDVVPEVDSDNDFSEDQVKLEDGEEALPLLADNEEDVSTLQEEEKIEELSPALGEDEKVAEEKLPLETEKNQETSPPIPDNALEEEELDEFEVATSTFKENADEDDAFFDAVLEGEANFDSSLIKTIPVILDIGRADYKDLVEQSLERDRVFDNFYKSDFNFYKDPEREFDEDKSTTVDEPEEENTSEVPEEESTEFKEDQFLDSIDALGEEEQEKKAAERIFASAELQSALEENDKKEEEGGDADHDLVQQGLATADFEKEETTSPQTSSAQEQTLADTKTTAQQSGVESDSLDAGSVPTADLQRDGRADEEAAKSSDVADESKQAEISASDVNQMMDDLDLDFELSDQGLNKPAKEKPNSEAEEKARQEIEFERALGIIETYSPKNKKTILGALESDVLEDDESNTVAKRVLDGDEEDRIAAYVANREYLKTYKEEQKKDFESFTEQQQFVHDHYKKQRALKFLRLVASVVFVSLFSFIFIFYGIDYLRSSYIYIQGFNKLEEKQYAESEEDFQRAYSIRASYNWANDFGVFYASRGLFDDAEKKYLLVLQEDGDHRKTLLNYGDLHVYTGDFIRAQQKFKQQLVNDPDDIEAKTKLARAYIEWGVQDETKWEIGDSLLIELIEKDSNNNLEYLANKLEIASLRGNYPISQFYYTYINEKDEDFFNRLAFRRYTDFLINNYAVLNSSISGKTLDPRITEKNNYTVHTIEDLIRKMFEHSPSYFPAYISTASWFDVLNESDKGEKWLDEGIRILETEVPSEVYLERYSPAIAYNLKGKLEYQKEAIYSARESFEKAVDWDADDSFAHYYLGKINLNFFDEIGPSQPHFQNAYENWNLPKDDQYRDLVYSLAYVNFEFGIRNGNEEDLVKAIGYWTDLLADPTLANYHVVEFALAYAYLQMKRYELGEAFAVENIRRLQPSFDYYKRSEGNVAKKIVDQVGMLSDSYNNLGVVYAAKAFSEEVRENRYVYKQKALENFINSVTLKEELKLLRGVPYANFNRINAFPQRSDEFLISDQLLAKSLLP